MTGCSNDRAAPPSGSSTPSGSGAPVAASGSPAGSPSQPSSDSSAPKGSYDTSPIPLLDTALATRYVSLSLGCADRPYPNKPSHVYDGDDTVRPPRELTPVFYGCFDWHSAVHGHWAMLRVLATSPSVPEADAIRKVMDAHLRPETIAKEVAFFREKRSKTFERPYGWGWLLRLGAELRTSKEANARAWESALEPLTKLLAEQFADYLARLSRPIREGTHANTAFALVHALDYARTVRDEPLETAIVTRARDFYAADTSCPIGYEPSGEDFISPCLVEADLMRRVLDHEAFLPWLDRFLPSLMGPEGRAILEPVEVRDRKDPRIGHLIGLFIQRAWCMRGLVAELPASDPRAELLERAARIHTHEALRQMADSGYGGEHWLASFAIYLLTDVRPAAR